MVEDLLLDDQAHPILVEVQQAQVVDDQLQQVQDEVEYVQLYEIHYRTLKQILLLNVQV